MDNTFSCPRCGFIEQGTEKQLCSTCVDKIANDITDEFVTLSNYKKYKLLVITAKFFQENNLDMNVLRMKENG